MSKPLLPARPICCNIVCEDIVPSYKIMTVLIGKLTPYEKKLLNYNRKLNNFKKKKEKAEIINQIMSCDDKYAQNIIDQQNDDNNNNNQNTIKIEDSLTYDTNKNEFEYSETNIYMPKKNLTLRDNPDYIVADKGDVDIIGFTV